MERMKRLGHLEVHDVTITTVGPLFIGDGRQRASHEWLRVDNDEKLILLDENRFFRWLANEGLGEAWQTYLQQNKPDATAFFAEGNRWQVIPKLCRAKLNIVYSARPVESIRTFIRNGRGEAYLAGSTIKGCIATALYVWRLNELSQQTRRQLMENVRQSVAQHASMPQSVTTQIFHQLFMNHLDKDDPVNHILRGWSFDDSEPIADEQMCLVKRYDEGPIGRSEQPEWREVVAPGTVIKTKLSLDMVMMSRAKMMLSMLNEALQNWQLLQERVYYDRIRVKNRAPIDRRALYIYLGGGVGFVNKSILYALFDVEEARTLSNAILAEKHLQYQPEYGQITAPYNRHLAKMPHDDGWQAHDMGKCLMDISY